MTEYNVGDKVRLVDNKCTRAEIGEIGTVAGLKGDCLNVHWETVDNQSMTTNEIEKVETTVNIGDRVKTIWRYPKDKIGTVVPKPAERAGIFEHYVDFGDHVTGFYSDDIELVQELKTGDRVKLSRVTGYSHIDSVVPVGTHGVIRSGHGLGSPRPWYGVNWENDQTVAVYGDDIELSHETAHVLAVGDRVKLLEKRYSHLSEIRQPEVGTFGTIIEDLDGDDDYRVQWDGDFTLYAHKDSIEWAGLRFNEVFTQEAPEADQADVTLEFSTVDIDPVVLKLFLGEDIVAKSYGEVFALADARFTAAAANVDTSHSGGQDLATALQSVLAGIVMNPAREAILRQLVGE